MDSTETTEPTTSPMGAVGLIVLDLLLRVYDGWVLSVIWGWHVSILFGLPRITTLQAIGLSVVVSHLVSHAPPKSAEVSHVVAWNVVHTSFMLFVAWLVHILA